MKNGADRFSHRLSISMMTQNMRPWDLAAKAQITTDDVIRYQTGTLPTIDVADRLAYALGLNVRKLISGTALEEQVAVRRKEIETELAPYFRRMKEFCDKVRHV